MGEQARATLRSLLHVRPVRGAHGNLGTLLGLLTSALLLAPHLSPYATVLVVAGLQIVTELLVGRNYGLALLLITPMALLMGQLAAARPTGELLFDRGVETVIGADPGGPARRRPVPRPTVGRGRGQGGPEPSPPTPTHPSVLPLCSAPADAAVTASV
jgi:hypothetical protein